MTLGPELIAPFLTLFVLELILGVDNVVFISILSGRLPKERQRLARILGLSLAMIMRIIFLIFASWITGLTGTVFGIGNAEAMQLSWRDIILVVGGLFLIFKATMEIHHKLEGADESKDDAKKQVTFAGVIVQILLVDAVFSIDSVITAVGMTSNMPRPTALLVMIVAVVASIGLMMLIAGKISDFVEKHPTVKMLALSFLILIGATLIAEGFDYKVEKALIYVPIAFAIGVEALNLIYRSRVAKGAQSKPVQLQGNKRLGIKAGSEGRNDVSATSSER